MKVALLKAVCGNCDATFARPQLSDFAYGEFILTGELGTVHAHFEISNPVWSFLDTALPPQSTNTKEQTARGVLLQAACAYFADTLAGQRLCNHFVCPQCRSSKLASWGGESTGFAELTAASFSDFMAKPENERQRLALELYSRIALNK